MFQVLSNFFFINVSGIVQKVFLKNTVTVFPEGGERENPTMTTSTVTARTKGDPQHYVEGINKYIHTSMYIYIYIYLYIFVYIYIYVIESLTRVPPGQGFENNGWRVCRCVVC